MINLSKIILKRVLPTVFAVCLLLPFNGAMAASVCTNSGYVFAFFNGIKTTKQKADTALVKLQSLYGTSRNGERVRYELMYNYSSSFFEDTAETFEQRLVEHADILAGRFELYFQILGDHESSWWSQITEAIPAAKSAFDSSNQLILASVATALTSLIANPPPISEYQEHATRIDNWVLEGKKLLFFAHSQGNLFMNVAYSYTSTKAEAGSFKAIHVAPASPQLNGDYTLADKDLVINLLRPTGSVPGQTTSLPNPFMLNPTSFLPNILLRMTLGGDAVGHNLFKTYLNPNFEAKLRVSEHVDAAFSSLTTPYAEASSGFFTATLTWDGLGDVDLHTYEPNGSHVYWRSRSGSAGYLDVDNTYSYGPEHYFASCDPEVLQTGLYTISVANYNNADGREAVVQIASSANGVLGTKKVVLGESTGSIPAYSMFTVNVTQDPETDGYSVSIGQ